MTDYIFLFGVLLFFHFLADYPLQGDFLAKAKNSANPVDYPWQHALFAHAFIHAGFVFIATGSLTCSVGELISHAYIDDVKSRGEITAHQDQVAHIVLKGVWVILVAIGAP